MTNEEVAQVIAYCEEKKISYKQPLGMLGVNPWNLYDAKRRYAPKQEGAPDIYGQDSWTCFGQDVMLLEQKRMIYCAYVPDLKANMHNRNRLRLKTL